MPGTRTWRESSCSCPSCRQRTAPPSPCPAPAPPPAGTARRLGEGSTRSTTENISVVKIFHIKKIFHLVVEQDGLGALVALQQNIK